MSNVFGPLFTNWNDKEAIDIKEIKRPKTKGANKIKINGETHYFVIDDENIYSFPYSKGQKKVVSYIFNIEKCKEAEYMDLERVYTEKLVSFNHGWRHSNYVTLKILDEIYKILKERR